MAAGKSDSGHHPYYPRDLKIPHYVENVTPAIELLVVFFGFVAILLIGTWIYSGTKSHLKGKFLTRSKICWFVVCFLTHGILEGYFAVNHATLAGEQTFLAQMWKEYGKADSRYIIDDSFTVCMETITAFIDGPLAAFAAYAFLTNSPTRHIFQLLLSLFQLYGDVLYMTTELMDGFSHGHKYHPLYFWFYFVFLNVLWIIIPLACIIESCLAFYASQSLCDAKQIKSKAK